MNNIKDLFDMTDRIAVITGGAGLLGMQHARALAEAGAIPILVDIDGKKVKKAALLINEEYDIDSIGIKTDITKISDIKKLSDLIINNTYGTIDILINNAANNPKIEKNNNEGTWDRFEELSLETWNKDLSINLTGAFLCSQVIGTEMAKRKKGVILNIASDLGVIAPDQRIYKKEGIPDNKQHVKPVTYSVSKFGLIGLTKYLATYWANKNIRVNSLSPAGVYTNQPEDFVKKLSNLIPMNRMAIVDEYKGAIVFLCSDASSYMTGTNLIIDGGKTSW